MKIKMTAIAAGPDGNFNPGDELDSADFPDKMLKGYVDAGYAVKVIPAGTETGPELAMVQTPETTESPKANKSGKSGK